MEDLEELKSRVAVLEHLVNDVLIGGLKKANDEYIDEDHYNKFKADYDEMLAPYLEPMRAVTGDNEYDLSRDLYEFSKKQEGYGTEDYDEKAVIENAINNIKDRIAAIKGVPSDEIDVAVKVEAPDSDNKDGNEDEDIPSDEQLAAEFAEAMGK